MCAAIGNSTKLSLTNNSFIDIRDLGAKAEHGYDNYLAFQKAVDYVVSKGGGTIYIPATDPPGGSRQYYISKPVFVDGDYVSIRGDDMNSTNILSWSAPFIFTRHPKKWKSRSSSYVDSDTGQTVQARDANGHYIFDGRYRTDLFRFRPQGDLKAGNSGQTPLEMPIDYSGVAYGLRPRGMVKGIFQGNPLATGCNHPVDVNGWEMHTAATFDFIYYAHNRPVEGGIAGCGDFVDPDPWLFHGTSSGNDHQFFFCMALTDSTLVNKAQVWIKFAQPVTTGLHRVSVQVDWVNNRFSVYVDRKQVSFELVLYNSAIYGARNYETITEADIFTKYDRFARWEWSDFALASRSRFSHTSDDGNTPNYSDYTIVATKVWPNARYTHGSVGQAQTKLNGSAPHDSETFMANNQAQGSIAGLTMINSGDIPNFDYSTGIDLMTMNYNSDRCYGFLVPNGNSSDSGLGPSAVYSCKISDLTINGYSFSVNNNGITLGPYLDLTIENIQIKGFYNAIGSLDIYVSYPLYLSNCKLDSKGVSYMAVNESHIIANNITFGYWGKCAIKSVGSATEWTNGIAKDAGPYAEAFFLGYSGKGIGAGHSFKNVMVNLEGIRYSPKIALFYLQKSFYHSENKLYIDNIICGPGSTIPFIFLDDPIYMSWSNYPGRIDVKNTTLPTDGQVIKVRGKDWAGTLDIGMFSDSVLDVGTSPFTFTNIKTIHRTNNSPPALGGWKANSHTIEITHPPEGGVTSWTCQSTGMDGTSQPPAWRPLRMSSTRKKNVLSGNVFASFYATVNAQHASLATQTNLKYATLQDYTASSLLRFLLNREYASNSSYVPMINQRNKFQLNFSFQLANRFFDSVGPWIKTDVLNNDTNLWTNSSNGAKTNKVQLNLATINGVGWWSDYIVTDRQAGFYMVLGDSNFAVQKLVASGRTLPQNPQFYNGQGITIPVGGLTLATASRDGSWSKLAYDRILDWLFGQASPSFPSTLYLGLSKTPIGADGSGLSEVSGSGYSRVALNLNSTNFKPHITPDFSYIGDYTVGVEPIYTSPTWSNAQNITFGSPTSDWGDCQWFFLSDSATNGNIWASGPLNQSTFVRSGETAPTFLPGCLQFQI